MCKFRWKFVKWGPSGKFYTIQSLAGGFLYASSYGFEGNEQALNSVYVDPRDKCTSPEKMTDQRFVWQIVPVPGDGEQHVVKIVNVGLNKVLCESDCEMNGKGDYCVAVGADQKSLFQLKFEEAWF